MKENRTPFARLTLAVVGFLTLVSTADAQPFTYQSGDLILTFRKVGAYQENYEAVADIGQATNYVNLPIGTTVTISRVSPSQLVTNSFDDFNNLKWAAVGALALDAGSYPQYTLWLTVPRRTVGVKNRDPVRLYNGSQSGVQGTIVSLLSAARTISSSLGTSNAVNNVYYVREPWADYPQYMLSDFMGGANIQVGTLQDTWVNNDLEKTTPNSFTNGVVQSDLYEIRPLTDGGGNPIVDPHTTLSTGPAYYVGYFQFDWTGTITFTRDAPQPKLSIARAGDVNTISFNGYTYATTYRLLHTSDLSTPIGSWTALPGTIAGNWTNRLSLQDTTSDPVRFYRVQAQ